MTDGDMESPAVLAEKLAAKQKELQELDGKIKDVTGRNPNERRSVALRIDRGSDRRRDRPDRPLESRLGPTRSSLKRRSGEDDEHDEVTEAKRAEADERASAARQERLKRVRRTSGGVGEKDLKRNKRMFGLLTSALRAGGQKSEKAKIAEAKQKEITEKLEKEREEEMQKRKELYNSRREAQAEIDRLASEVLKTKMQPEWDKHNKSLGQFLSTKASPKIFFIPAKHNTVTEKLLKSAAEAAEIIKAEKLQAAEEATARRKARAARGHGEKEEHGDEDESEGNRAKKHKAENHDDEDVGERDAKEGKDGEDDVDNNEEDKK